MEEQTKKATENEQEPEAEDLRGALWDLGVMEHAAVLLERKRACQNAYTR